jgi:purine-nucleoside phosphorylase
VVIPYRDIPHVPVATVAGHAGELVAGAAEGIPILLLSGRVHIFEGWSQRQATVLLRACLTLGVQILVVCNSSGGINPALDPGDVMLITDTINLSGDNPLIGPNLDRFGPRFPAMANAFDSDLRERAEAAAKRAGVNLRAGVYVMLTGPAYETRAELHMLRVLGADAVGMSTVPDVLVARHAGVRVLAFSVVGNKATPEMEEEVTHEDVLAMGAVGAARLTALLRELLPEIA